MPDVFSFVKPGNYFSLFSAMLRIFPGLLTLLIVTLAAGQNIVHLRIKSLPVYHPSGSDIYAAGSFNG